MSFLWIPAHALTILGIALTIVAIAHMLTAKRSPSSAMAWLVGIVAMLYIVVPLYLSLGGRKMQGRANSKTKLTLVRGPEVPEAEAGVSDRFLRASGLPGATRGNRVTLCPTGEVIYEQLMTMLDGAEQSIDVETFVFARDEVAGSVVEKLAAKAREGVAVRLIVDGVGSLHTKRSFFRPLLDAGGRVVTFMPVLHNPLRRERVNLRNHRKMLIVDRRCVLAGGTNIAIEYIGPDPYPGRWVDLSFTLEGPAAAEYDRIFRSDWAFANRQPIDDTDVPDPPSLRTDGDADVQVIPSGPDMVDDLAYQAFLSNVFSAQSRLWMVTPYFVPDDAIVQALIIAARRGADVRLYTPARSNHRMTDYAGAAYMRDIRDGGVKILRYTPGMVHAKVTVVDDRLATVGSSNIDLRSLFLNYEVTMAVSSPPEVAAVTSWIEDRLAGASARESPTPRGCARLERAWRGCSRRFFRSVR